MLRYIQEHCTWHVPGLVSGQNQVEKYRENKNKIRQDIQEWKLPEKVIRVY
jgi:hypothetical protein